MVASRPEPEWDEWDVALIDALADWKTGLHSCGHHENDLADPEAVFVPGFTVCRACESLQDAQKKQRTADADALKRGENPDFPRRWRVRRTTRAEYRAEQAAKAAARAGKKSVDELMAQVRQQVADALSRTE